jgi:hypothetical protein
MGNDMGLRPCFVGWFPLRNAFCLAVESVNGTIDRRRDPETGWASRKNDCMVELDMQAS